MRRTTAAVLVLAAALIVPAAPGAALYAGGQLHELVTGLLVVWESPASLPPRAVTRSGLSEAADADEHRARTIGAVPSRRALLQACGGAFPAAAAHRLIQAGRSSVRPRAPPARLS